jgi:hypothetical protein
MVNATFVVVFDLKKSSCFSRRMRNRSFQNCFMNPAPSSLTLANPSLMIGFSPPKLVSDRLKLVEGVPKVLRLGFPGVM